MERGDVLPAGLFVRRLFEFCDWFYFRISQLIVLDALITPQGPMSILKGMPGLEQIRPNEFLFRLGQLMEWSGNR
ncbi:hypothetical protein TNCV_1860271 [Trichonephila clavipes]|nr:hypothetical protein TNCV_1860271 [Trichonephila clavipes]